MIYTFFAFLFFSFFALSLTSRISNSPLVTRIEKKRQNHTLTTPLLLCHFSDFHSAFDSPTIFDMGSMKISPPFLSFIQRYQEICPSSHLKTFGGDFTEGSILTPQEIPWIDHLGLDIVTLGNHDWDFGEEILSHLWTIEKNSKHSLQIVTSNVIDHSHHFPWPSYVLKDDGREYLICFFGISPLITADSSAVPSHFSFLPYASSLATSVRSCEEEAEEKERLRGEEERKEGREGRERRGVVRILLSHAGIVFDREIYRSKEMPFFHLILGSHSHITIDPYEEILFPSREEREEGGEGGEGGERGERGEGGEERREGEKGEGGKVTYLFHPSHHNLGFSEAKFVVTCSEGDCSLSDEGSRFHSVPLSLSLSPLPPSLLYYENLLSSRRQFLSYNSPISPISPISPLPLSLHGTMSIYLSPSFPILHCEHSQCKEINCYSPSISPIYLSLCQHLPSPLLSSYGSSKHGLTASSLREIETPLATLLSRSLSDLLPIASFRLDYLLTASLSCITDSSLCSSLVFLHWGEGEIGEERRRERGERGEEGDMERKGEEGGGMAREGEEVRGMNMEGEDGTDEERRDRERREKRERRDRERREKRERRDREKFLIPLFRLFLQTRGDYSQLLQKYEGILGFQPTGNIRSWIPPGALLNDTLLSSLLPFDSLEPREEREEGEEREERGKREERGLRKGIHVLELRRKDVCEVMNKSVEHIQWLPSEFSTVAYQANRHSIHNRFGCFPSIFGGSFSFFPSYCRVHEEKKKKKRERERGKRRKREEREEREERGEREEREERGERGERDESYLFKDENSKHLLKNFSLAKETAIYHRCHKKEKKEICTEDHVLCAICFPRDSFLLHDFFRSLQNQNSPTLSSLLSYLSPPLPFSSLSSLSSLSSPLLSSPSNDVEILEKFLPQYQFTDHRFHSRSDFTHCKAKGSCSPLSPLLSSPISPLSPSLSLSLSSETFSCSEDNSREEGKILFVTCNFIVSGGDGIFKNRKINPCSSSPLSPLLSSPVSPVCREESLFSETFVKNHFASVRSAIVEFLLYHNNPRIEEVPSVVVEEPVDEHSLALTVTKNQLLGASPSTLHFHSQCPS